MTVAPVSNPTAERPVVLVNPHADFNQTPAGRSRTRLIAWRETGWGIYPGGRSDAHGVFELQQPIHAAEPMLLKFELQQELGRQHLIGRFRLAVSDEVVPRQLERSTFPVRFWLR